MTDQQKKNCAAILAKARIIIAKNKKEAVEQNDFARSMRLAANEAQVEQYFRDQGIDIP